MCFSIEVVEYILTPTLLIWYIKVLDRNPPKIVESGSINLCVIENLCLKGLNY